MSGFIKPEQGRRLVQVQVPGKVMLAGEYAVLNGGRALAATIDRWLQVDAYAAPAGQPVQISSQLWPEPYALPWPLAGACPAIEEPLLVQSVRRAYQSYGYAHPLVIAVRSALRVADGVGSSSAMRLAVNLALASLTYAEQSDAEQSDAEQTQAPLPALGWQAAQCVYEEQLAAQGFASGYDIATQLLGGLVLFAHDRHAGVWPHLAQSQALTPGLLGSYVQPFVGGEGAPTTGVGRATLAWLAEQGTMARLEHVSEGLVASLLAFFEQAMPGRHALDAEPWRAVLRFTKELRGVFAGSPHEPRALLAGLARLPGCDESWTFKTSGAGGEDALLLLGDDETLKPAKDYLGGLGWYPLGARFCDEGARVVGFDQELAACLGQHQAGGVSQMIRQHSQQEG